MHEASKVPTCSVTKTKGQLISKWLFGFYLQFFPKTNKKIDLTTMLPQVEFSSHFIAVLQWCVYLSA